MFVLMIEDNEADFILFSHHISKIDNVTIAWCNTLAKGLAYIETNPVELLLLDMSLPDGKGLYIFDQVQAKFPELAIIILSGSNMEEIALEAIRRGAQDYLSKDGINQESFRRSLRYALERKRIEKRLRDSEELHQAFARNFPNGALVLYNHDLRYTLVDGLGLEELGLSKEGMEGKTIWEVFSPEMAAAGAVRMRAALAGENIIQEITYAGETILMNYVPIRDSNGSIISGMIMSQTITKRKQLEAQVIQVAIERERVKDLQQFISDLSHDFRTPLTAIGTDAYLLLRSPDLEKRQQYFNRIELQVRQMTRLMERLLFMSRLDAGEYFDFRAVNMASLLQAVGTRFLSIAQKKDVQFVIDLPNLLPIIPADEAEILRAVEELIDNAIAFTPEMGTVTLHAETRQNNIVITVQDTGLGISAEDLPHIFKRLYRGDKARSAERAAAGLGLSIAEKIVEGHKGHITVESTIGVGSVFQMFLPVTT